VNKEAEKEIVREGEINLEDQEAEKSIEWRTLNSVRVPFASPELLWRMKCKTHREKDQADLLFLRRLIEASGGKVPE
jgi:hypothetical protein